MPLMNLLPAADIAADALQANRLSLDIISQNIANAQTTRDIDGSPYQRKHVVFESYLHEARPESRLSGVRASEVVEDPEPGPKVFLPGHPHADKNGMVQMPNVNMAMEMVDLITTSRAYEANLTVVRTARQMAQQALNIGK